MLGEASREIDIPEQIRSDVAFSIQGGMPPFVVEEGLPLCNFELKGPIVDLSRIEAERIVHERRRKAIEENSSPSEGQTSSRRRANRRSTDFSTDVSTDVNIRSSESASGDRPALNSAYRSMVFLVTEFVGRGLVRDRNHQLWIGDSPDEYEIVDKREEPLICASALDGLRKLRDAGYLQGDVALRNRQAELQVKGSKVFWRTWWVDLGLAAQLDSRMKTHMYLVDRVDVSSMFSRA